MARLRHTTRWNRGDTDHGAGHTGRMRASTAVPLSGRDDELQTLLEVVRLGTSGSPQAVLVQGEAGVGKTALVRAVVEQAAKHGTQVLWGQALRFGAVEAAYHPLVLALEGWLAGAGDVGEGRDHRGDPGRRAGAAVPGRGTLGLRLPPDDRGRRTDRPGGGARADGAGGRRRPVGRPVHLGRAGLPRGGLLAATVRPARDPAGRAGGFGRIPAVAGQHQTPAGHARAEHRPGSNGRRPSTRSSILLGGEPSSRLVDQVYERSRGNPYFTELLVRRTPLGSTDLPDVVPDELSQALLESWRALGGPAREMTRLLAVAGRPSTVTTLSTVGAGLGIEVVGSRCARPSMPG